MYHYLDVPIRVVLMQEMELQTTAYSRDGSVGIATSYGLDARGVGVRAPVGAIFFSSRC
jgi:hypothetical protein